MIFGRTFEQRKFPRIIKWWALIPVELENGNYIWLQHYYIVEHFIGRPHQDFELLFYATLEEAQSEIESIIAIKKGLGI